MKYFTKIRLAWFFVILLSAVNITLFVVYFTGFHHHGFNHTNREKEGCPDKQECMLRSELKLDSSQIVKYDQIKKEHHLKARPIVDSLREIRSTLMLDLKKDTIDSLQINGFVQQINEYNNRLFELSIFQYIQIKKILNPNQKEQLSKIYCDMFGCSSSNKGGDCCGKKDQKSCGSNKGCE